MKAGRGVGASPVEELFTICDSTHGRLFVCHYIARMERMDEYAVLGSRRMDCIGRVVTRPSDWEDRESTT